MAGEAILSDAAFVLIRVLPIELAVLFTRLITLIYLLLCPGYRQEIQANYRTIFGRAAPLFWVYNAWTTGRNLALMAKIGTPWFIKLVDTAEIYWENYADEQFVERKMHTIMASFHFGLWEFLPQIFSRMGCNVAVMVSRQNARRLDGRLQQIRKQGGVRLIFSLRGLLERLMQPGITGFMLDNTARGAQTQVKFASFSPGLSGLRLPVLAFKTAHKIGAKVFPIFCYLKRGKIMVKIFPPGDEQACAQALLKMVKGKPSEWIFWAKAGALNPEL
ncbi:MAG: LpxL/LpxP family acyltransferase [bacterium]